MDGGFPFNVAAGCTRGGRWRARLPPCPGESPNYSVDQWSVGTGLSREERLEKSEVKPLARFIAIELSLELFLGFAVTSLLSFPFVFKAPGLGCGRASGGFLGRLGLDQLEDQVKAAERGFVGDIESHLAHCLAQGIAVDPGVGERAADGDDRADGRGDVVEDGDVLEAVGSQREGDCEVKTLVEADRAIERDAGDITQPTARPC